jgi:RNA polymerase sigma-70 factor (ECF subfamily)
VTVTTLLMALRTQSRRNERPTVDEDPIIDPIVGSNPELNYLKARYRETVTQSIVSALTQLGDREKVLLRLHLCERLSIDRLGVIYSVNRATAARWLAAARAALLQHTRAEIQRRMGVTDRECDSILNLVQGEVDVSVARHLNNTGAHGSSK